MSPTGLNKTKSLFDFHPIQVVPKGFAQVYEEFTTWRPFVHLLDELRK
jgi:hypothetical protein